MRGITVRQPWATAIVRMGKDVENRSRNIAGSYRGPVAIHAGLATPGRRGSRTTFAGVGEVEHDTSGLLLRSKDIAWPYRLPVGLIIGVVDLVGVHHATDTTCLVCEEGCCGCSPWAAHGQTHLELANHAALGRPIPYVGQLGLWTVPDDVVARICDDLDTPNGGAS